ncbi:MAG: SDR family NAD(P)-dependent oxidoreductase [Pyrinomonadaceae bacterium]
MSAQSVHAFAEKVALISDGTNPVGRAVAMQLALQGSYVIVGLPQESEEHSNTLEELKSLGTLANAVKADISTVEGAKILVAEVEKMFGRIDLLVNCLKLETDSVFDETSEKTFEEAVNANLKSTFFVTQEALKLMKPRPKPKIVNLVSAIDTPETQSNVLYSAMQNAVIGLTKSLAKALPKNFRVNAVAVSEKQNKSENLDAELFRAKKGISEDDVARTIVYLLSSEAIGLNGQILIVE